MSGESRGCKAELSLPWCLSETRGEGKHSVHEGSVQPKCPYQEGAQTGIVLRPSHLVIWKSPVGQQTPNPMAWVDSPLSCSPWFSVGFRQRCACSDHSSCIHSHLPSAAFSS